MTWKADGCRVIATHTPSGETHLEGVAATPADAERAAGIIARGYALNNARKYTASARMYARLDELDGWKEAN